MKRTKAIRGMHDILPSQTPLWQHLESQLSRVLRSYGYSEIRMPVLEVTELFKRSVGEVTDIVEKEMYTFPDRNNESLTLRPEGTAGCVRAAEEHGLLFNQTQRLWYQGPMFRYERPQKGRYRQFHQMGVEAFGLSGPDIDAELILMSARFWEELGISEHVNLQLNSIGSKACRLRFNEALVEFLEERIDQLDKDSQERLNKNPLRILDSKCPETQSLLDDAPVLSDFLDEESVTHFDGLCRILDANNIRYERNTRLVRGLDYYSKTVFEWVTDSLGAQGTVCAGGRYDGLVEQLGGKPTPAVGFAMGIERLILLVENISKPADIEPVIDLYCIAFGVAEKAAQIALAETLRRANPGLIIVNHCGSGSAKNQLKKADKSGARFALLMGEDELKNNRVILKPLRDRSEQQTFLVDDIAGLAVSLGQKQHDR